MSELDDLRSTLNRDDDDESEFALPVDFGEEAPQSSGDGRLLGMTAGERALLSGLVFLVVMVIGLALLVITERVVLPF